MLRYYYFTFGTDPDYPFAGGWVTIAAPSRQAAAQIFRIYYPNDADTEVLNCADYYTEEEFQELGMEETGNFGAFCHEIIEPKKRRQYQHKWLRLMIRENPGSWEALEYYCGHVCGLINRQHGVCKALCAKRRRMALHVEQAAAEKSRRDRIAKKRKKQRKR